ncbi:uncharacterized protein LOC131294673 [Anopheles ziemanni]|uniref:uncharacterized protein LOC131265265 n=1 Tax=Anopheles coustani TaxID=139045 RepID=UPI00265964CF|nr:uncharacterized protein LOC131265265 [Anopheles coustani]XP_058178699.1 uncharacterized protein LOC131294673 [Anopheles ziemanni]
MLGCRVSRFCIILTISSVWLVSCVSARRHHRHPEPLKYSYGIYAPTSWTVALYIWYIVKLGFILGALLLLLFAKKWNSRGQPVVIESGPEFYHHRSLDAPEHNLFKASNIEDVKLFWSDRIEAVVNKFNQ